jgi:hypothetical protein
MKKNHQTDGPPQTQTPKKGTAKTKKRKENGKTEKQQDMTNDHFPFRGGDLLFIFLGLTHGGPWSLVFAPQGQS